MQQDLQWRCEPSYQEDLESQRIQRTDPYGRHPCSVSSEAYRDTQVYRKRFNTLVAENQVLARENDILRNFLLLKKENCDLKTLDMITNALAMCDEKLNEFILNLYSAPDRRKPISFATVDTRPHHTANIKPNKYVNEEPRSPSYGASFPEIHYSDLEAYDGNQISMSTSDNRRYPESSKNKYQHDEYSGGKHYSGRCMHDDSASYGQSFPQLHYDELFEDTAPQRKNENTTEYKATYRNEYPNEPPLIASFSSPRTIFSPILRNMPNSGRQQGAMSNTRTIKQPNKQFFSETPRQCLRTMSPSRPQNKTRGHFDSQHKCISPTQFDTHGHFDSQHKSISPTQFNTHGHFDSQHKSISPTQFDTHSSKFSSFRPNRYSSTPARTEYYDSLEASEMEKRKFTTHPSSYRHSVSNLLSYQKQAGGFYKDFISPKMNSKRSDEGNYDEIYQRKLYRPATGNVDSFCKCSSPTYTSAGQHQEMDFIASKMLNKTSYGNSQTLTYVSPTVSEAQDYIRQRQVAFDSKHPSSPSPVDRSDIEIIHGNGRVIIKSPKSSLKKHVIVVDNQNMTEKNQMKQGQSIVPTQDEQFRTLNSRSKTLADDYKQTDTNRSIENNQENEKSVWINITQRARILNERYDDAQDQDTSVEHQKLEDTGYPKTADFQAIESPLYTSTPKHSYTKKEAHVLSGNRQEFDESLADIVYQTHPKPGRTEIIKSVLYRPVDILTGYSPNVTLHTTELALRSKPNRRLLGEIAFQLDRRIMQLVIGLRNSSDKKIKRSRYYGYSIANINQLIENEASLKSQSNPYDIHKVEEEMKQRFEYVLATLKPIGYDLNVHAYFTQDIVNKYGLMKEAPHMDSVEGFGLHEPVILRMLLGRFLGYGPVLENMLILLDCLCFLSHSDKSPLFMW